MRIIRGSLKGMRFKKLKSFSSRPTTDYAKEGLFNILENTIDLEELEVLDLFSGLGSISFEFISRGVPKLTSVDNNFQSCKYIRHSSKEHDLSDTHTIVQMDALKYIQKVKGDFNFIFADPPYDFGKYDQLIDLIKNHEILRTDGTLVIEHGKKTSLTNIQGFQKTKPFGHVYFSFFNFDLNND